MLYHFVGHSSSRSAQPVTMIRRLTEKVPKFTLDQTALFFFTFAMPLQ